uniref:Uncharacterized protein n=1 Tax=Palpitomonas bilix TaxID=652834 RepID=A0A7S3GAI4_9EUKA
MELRLKSAIDYDSFCSAFISSLSTEYISIGIGKATATDRAVLARVFVQDDGETLAVRLTLGLESVDVIRAKENRSSIVACRLASVTAILLSAKALIRSIASSSMSTSLRGAKT